MSGGRKNEKFYIVDKRLDIYHSMAYNYLMNKNYLKIIIEAYLDEVKNNFWNCLNMTFETQIMSK